MHVVVDFDCFLLFIVLALAGAIALLHLERRNVAETGSATADKLHHCAVCGLPAGRRCRRCKMVDYCSEDCHRPHWNSGHKAVCKDLQSIYEANYKEPSSSKERIESSVLPSSTIRDQSTKLIMEISSMREKAIEHLEESSRLQVANKKLATEVAYLKKQVASIAHELNEYEDLKSRYVQKVSAGKPFLKSKAGKTLLAIRRRIRKFFLVKDSPSLYKKAKIVEDSPILDKKTKVVPDFRVSDKKAKILY